jgi:hypothetical protein
MHELGGQKARTPILRVVRDALTKWDGHKSLNAIDPASDLGADPNRACRKASAKIDVFFKVHLNYCSRAVVQ